MQCNAYLIITDCTTVYLTSLAWLACLEIKSPRWERKIFRNLSGHLWLLRKRILAWLFTPKHTIERVSIHLQWLFCCAPSIIRPHNNMICHPKCDCQFMCISVVFCAFRSVARCRAHLPFQHIICVFSIINDVSFANVCISMWSEKKEKFSVSFLSAASFRFRSFSPEKRLRNAHTQ